jgi:hypothetical protein
VNPPDVDEAVKEAIRANGGARLMVTHWEVAYWNLIAPYKQGKYSVASAHNPDPNWLNIFSYQKIPLYNYVPVRIPQKRTPGLTLIGSYSSAYGPEWAFGFGRGIDETMASRSRYIVLELAEQTTLDVQPTVWGLSPEDGLQFRYTLKSPSGEATVSDWGDPARKLPKPPAGSTLLVEVREKDGTGAPAATEFPLGSSKPFELPGS